MHPQKDIKAGTITQNDQYKMHPSSENKHMKGANKYIKTYKNSIFIK
jgi:hypothetical protein